MVTSASSIHGRRDDGMKGQLASGTIPSKTLREAALRLSGYRERGIYGASYPVKQHITMRDLLFRVDHVISNEIDVARHQLMRNGVDILTAQASFVDAHRLRLELVPDGRRPGGGAATIIIAVGTTTMHDPFAHCDGQHVFTCDDLLGLEHLPRSLAVVGAGVVGLEYACIFAALGVRVTLIDGRAQLLPFVDREIMDALVYHLRENRATFILARRYRRSRRYHDEHGDHVRLHLASGKQVVTDKVLYSVGRRGATDTLALEAAGLAADDRGRLRVNDHYQTEVPHIYAVGDVIGFPSLASTSMEQGRLAACHALASRPTVFPSCFPTAYTRSPGCRWSARPRSN